MNTLISWAPILIGSFFVTLAVVQYRWGVEQSAIYGHVILNSIFVIFSGVYGIVILYNVIEGLVQ